MPELRIYHDRDHRTCSVAEDGFGWLPGVYASEEAARYASEFTYQQLAAFTHWSVRGRCEAYRPVTLDDLRHLRERVGSDETVVDQPEGFDDLDEAMCDWVRRQMAHMGFPAGSEEER